MNTFPTHLYSAEAVARLDKAAIKSGIPGYTLMRRAGQAVFDVIQECYPDSTNILVVCGAGNNAGDGYVVARLAQQHGKSVRVASLVEPESLKGDAAQAYRHWQECGDTVSFTDELLEHTELVVDALLGTGLTREVEGQWKAAIESINRSDLPVIAVDIPSGLNADTGVIAGAAVNANHTVSFIGLKKGLFTASGRACCGAVSFSDLQVPASVCEGVEYDAELLTQPAQWSLPRRRHDNHKGENGHVLIIGGNHGMTGAVILAARAALRAGAGLVSVLTRAEHVNAVVSACPECMVHGSMNGEIPPALLDRVDYLAIGCGLGQDAWAQRLLYLALISDKPMVLDADALNMLAGQDGTSLTEECIITPHPGEAARLLGVTARDIQQDRFAAALALKQKYNARVVLKGSGTIVQQTGRPRVCALGNPAMATAGMGDVLTGMIAATVAQGYSLNRAVIAAVCRHARAADLAAAGDDRGLMATDVIEHIRAAASQVT